MRKTFIMIFVAAICAMAALNVPAAAKSAGKQQWKPDHKIRISWEKASFQEYRESFVENKGYIEHNFYYPRAKKLSDGAILLSYSNHHYGFDIYAARSEDEASTWSNAVCIAHSYPSTRVTSGGETVNDRVVFVNPDFIELQDGRIIMAFQWRYIDGYADLPKTNENCGIMVSFSSDKGVSWTEPREVYRGRCWEPAFLQLPSGEIQMYVTSSQDIKDKTSFPRTMVIRSFDGGKTWQGKECCGIHDNEVVSRSYDERFAYDGMPSAVLLDDGKGIVVPLESWHGRLAVDQTPIVVKTTMEENWHLDQEKVLAEGGPDYPMKKEVNKDLQGYGPYSTKLPGGEVVVLCNGTYKGVQGIWTLIGDKTGDNFHFATSPFNASEYWGNIDYIGNNKVIATGTFKYKGWNEENLCMVRLMKGRLNSAKEITRGSLDMVPVGEFDRQNDNGWWFLGKKFEAGMFASFGYTDEGLELGTYMFDTRLASFTPENSDAAAILFSRPGGGNYEMVVNPSGKYVIYEEAGYSWHKIASGTTDDLEVVGTINDDSDTDLGYSAKVTVPWQLIGGKPSKNEEIKVHLRRFYKDKSAEKPLSVVEDLEGENSDYPCEWLGVTLK